MNAVISVPKGAGLENPRSANLYDPQTQIEIHSITQTYAPGNRIDPNNSFVSWNFQKVLSSQNSSQEVGTATITLTAEPLGAPGQTWKDLVSPQDLVVIYSSKDGPNLRTRFVGYVDDVLYFTDTTDAQNPQRYVQISASDPMVAFLANMVFTSQNISPAKTVGGVNAQGRAVLDFYKMINELAINWGGSSGGNNLAWPAWLAALLGKSTRASQLSNMTPSQTVSAILNTIMKALYQPVVQVRTKTFAGSATWLKLVSQAFADTSQFAGSAYWVTPQDGPLISSVLPVMNAPFLEFFGDMRSADEFGANSAAIPKPSPSGISFGQDQAQFCIVIRPTPFDTTSGAPGTSATAFEQLPMTDVWLKDTSGQQIYQTKEDVVNYYWVYPEGYMTQSNATLAAVKELYGALIDTASVVKYGLQPLEVPIFGQPQGNSAQAYNPQNIQKWEQALYDWYNQNPTYERGTLTIHGDPSVRVGQRIRVPSIRLIGYVEGVQETFDRFNQYTQTVTFSRGVYY